MRQSVMKNWICGLMILAFLAVLQPALHAEKVLYVQNNNLRDTVKMINILKAQGHDLTVWTTSSDGNALTAQEYANLGYELLIVDEVVGSGNVGAAFRGSPIPVLNWEGYLYSGNRSAFNPDSGLSGGNYADAAEAIAANGGLGADYGQIINETNINIVDASHPLAAGLGAGLVGVFDSAGAGDADGPGVISFAGTRTFITNVQVVAETPGFSGGMCIFTVPVDAINADGTTNLALWTHLPWNTSSADRVLVEPSFFLFEAGVAWSLGKAEPTKIRDFTPETGAFLPTNTVVSFSVDKVTAAGSAVSSSDIHLTLNGLDVIGSASVVDGGSTWDVSYTAGLPKNETITIAASATAADGGFSARQGQVDTIDPNNYSFEAEDFNFEGGSFFDNPVLCDTLGGGPNCYYDRVGYTNVDKLELDFTVTATVGISNEVYRWGGISAVTREEWTDTFASDDSLVRTQYSAANLPEWEVRNITSGEWMNYTRTYPTGLYNIYMRVSAAGSLEAQVDMVDAATTTNQNLTKLGRFVAPSGTPGYALVAMTDDAANAPIVVELTSTSPTTLRVSALTDGWIPNFFMLIPTELPPNEPPSVAITAPAEGDTLTAGVEITITANPSDTDGTITNVAFYAGPFGETLALIGEATSAPWEMPFTPANLGDMSFQSIRTVATDDGGLQASDEVNVRVLDPAVIMVSTAVGNGADAEAQEQSNLGVTSSSTGRLNTRTSGNGDRNEIIGLRFDLSGYTLSELQNVKLNIVEMRNNGSRRVAVYGVAQGTVGGFGAYTTEDWNETNLVAFGSLPGLLDTDNDPLTQSLNTNALTTLVADQTYTGTTADVDVFDTPELSSFVTGYTGSSLITFIVAAAPTYTSSGQGRMASKEATALENSGPSGSAGDFAPFLSFTLGGPELEYSSDGSNLTFTWSGAYKLQAQTNSLSTGLTTGWGDYPGGGSSGTVVPIDTGNPTVFFRLAPQ